MKTVSNDLFLLIKSLNKQEKRYFKLYASRHVIGEKNQYVRLFDAIDRQKEYDEVKIKKRFAGEAFIKQLHVSKNYLYKLILNSLRLYSEDKSGDKFPILLRNAQLLAEKGLAKQSEKTLAKALKLAQENERFLQILEVYRLKHTIIHNNSDFKQLETYVNVDFQKELNILDIYRNYLEFQLLHDRVFIPYWKKGSIRNQDEKEAFSQLFEKELYQNIHNAKSFNARMFYHNARFTFYFLTGELQQCYEHIRQQALMFEQLPTNQRKGKRERRYVSTLINLYIVQRELRLFQEALATLRKLREIPAPSITRKAYLFTRSYNLETDLYLSTGQFRKGMESLPAFEEEFKRYHDYIEKQHRLGLYYNLAYLNFGARDFDRSLDWINLLLNDPDLKTREDIHCFGRILSLFIHYELGNDQLLEYIVKSTYRFLSRRKRLFKVESIILRFLKKYPNWISRQDILVGFEELKLELEELMSDEYERRAFDYFDFISWLESKTGTMDFAEIVNRKKMIEV
ncbi:MAG: hypothetical protein AAGG75_23685 [Bacteroidota bacterium]